MSDEILSLLSGSDQDFARGLVELGWYDYAPTIADHPFLGRARSLLEPKLRSAGDVRGTDAYVYRLDVPGGRWQDARAVVESHLKAEPQFGIVFCCVNGELYIFVPEDPEKARSRNSLINAAYIRLDVAHPKEFEEKLVQKLRGAPQDSFRAVLQSLTTVEKVTKKFYDEFKKHKDRFVEAIEGIPSGDHRRWYASVVLNRLMFIYFLQENGFLGEERGYLQAHLDRHESYYRDFLMPLFLEHLGRRREDRPAATDGIPEDIPYLNGGLFLEHRLEEQYRDAISIENDAFKRMLDFFSRYTWYIRDVPIQNEKHISPDVLGHIFEKYVNQKEMGAYYTKPDITGYICRNTIIPRLFDMLAETGEKGKNAVRPLRLPNGSAIEDYVYNAVKQTDYLPTETDREYKARRERYESILRDFGDGKIAEINDFITYNLDIEQFALDFVDHITDADVLRRFYFDCVKKITVLDPTCGSGAFLLTAVEILYPLYDGCLRRMQALVELADRPRPDARTIKGEFAFVNEVDAQPAFIDPGSVKEDILADFREELARFAEHPLEYYIHKSIIVNNLFGVDIEEEAVEICKLRLFLKLISHAKPDASKENRGIEPLPDIDFNILAGNTLVGYTSTDDIDRLWQSVEFADEKKSGSFSFEKDHTQLRIRVGHYRDRLRLYRECELGLRPAGLVTRDDLAEDRAWAKEELDKDIWRLYRKAGKVADGMSQKDFLRSHIPFHWLLEFPGVMEDRGFDAIIGNPPWVEYKNVRRGYEIAGFATRECNNLWAFVTERSINLLRPLGRCGLIVPMSLSCTERMITIQKMVRMAGDSWISNYESDSNPGQLFDGVKQNVSILLGTRYQAKRTSTHTTRLYRFFSEARPVVFPLVQYTLPHRDYLHFGFPKVSESIENRILDKLCAHPPLRDQLAERTQGSTLYVHRIAHYYIKALDFVPYFRSDRDGLKKSEDYKEYAFTGPAQPLVAAISSTTFYFYWQVFYDAFKAGKQCVEGFPCGSFDRGACDSLSQLCGELMADMGRNSKRLKAKYEATGAVEYDQFYPRLSKPIIDDIDRVLAKHYGFTEEELDFIINYDIKYRMGRDSGNAEDEEE